MVEHAVARLLVGDPAALLADTERRQTEASGRDAGHNAAVGCVGFGAVLHQSGVRMALLPEIEKTGLFYLIQEAVVFGSAAPGRDLRWAPDSISNGRLANMHSRRPFVATAFGV